MQRQTGGNEKDVGNAVQYGNPEMADLPVSVTMGPYNFHIDANSAFLSWSAAYRVNVLGEKTDLRLIPGIVGGDQEKRHGIVLAKSKPAKKFGIKTGEAIVTAKQKCPGFYMFIHEANKGYGNDFEERRCLVPVTKFYEWKKLNVKQKEKYEFFNPDNILYLTGIYHKDPSGDRFTILTREAEGCMVGVHHRMPLILGRKDMGNWLFSKKEAAELLESHFKELQKTQYVKEIYQQMSLF